MTPQAAEKILFVIPREARDLLFFSASKKQQIPRANPALRNDTVRVFPQPVQPSAWRCPRERVRSVANEKCEPKGGIRKSKVLLGQFLIIPFHRPYPVRVGDYLGFACHQGGVKQLAYYRV